MLRSLGKGAFSAVQTVVRSQVHKSVPVVTKVRCCATTAEPFGQYEELLRSAMQNNEISGYMLRSILMMLHDQDMVPDPKVSIDILKACRQINDYALAIRFMETMRFKCGGDKEVIAYIDQELGPTLKELGISTIEEMGYDKPELAYPDVWEMH